VIEGNLSNVRREASNISRKSKEMLKDKINELVSDIKNKNIRDLYRAINEFKNCNKRKTNFVKDKKCDPLADPHNVLNRRKNYFCQLLNVCGAGGAYSRTFCAKAQCI
jgi:hypothetical protein